MLQIRFGSNKNLASTGDYVVELPAVAGGLPTNTVLAQVSVPNASVSSGTVTVSATLSGPQLLTGTQNAAAISRPGGNQFEVVGGTGSACAGSAYVQSPIGTSAFVDLTATGDRDLLGTVTILAWVLLGKE